MLLSRNSLPVLTSNVHTGHSSTCLESMKVTDHLNTTELVYLTSCAVDSDSKIPEICPDSTVCYACKTGTDMKHIVAETVGVAKHSLTVGTNTEITNKLTCLTMNSVSTGDNDALHTVDSVMNTTVGHDTYNDSTDSAVDTTLLITLCLNANTAETVELHKTVVGHSCTVGADPMESSVVTGSPGNTGSKGMSVGILPCVSLICPVKFIKEV